MMFPLVRRRLIATFAFAILGMLAASPTLADFTSAAYRLAVAEAVQADKDLAAFYKETAYEPLWTGRNREDRERRAAFLKFLKMADFHGLPQAKYAPDKLERQIKTARTQLELAKAEVAFSETFLTFAKDIQTGILVPKDVDEGIVRKVPHRDRKSYLTALSKSTPSAFFRSLAPNSPEYARLANEKMRLRAIVRAGGYGPDVPGGDFIGLGAKGARVAAIRNRLVALGYLEKGVSSVFDRPLEQAVIAFQKNHGLKADGIIGPSTIEMLNMTAKQRLKAVMVAMERERWTNMDRGKRHVLVNLADFSAKIIDDGEITFYTRSVIGHPDPDRRSPEFSDQIEHMVINPTWHVPRSIATKEYLPMLKENRYAVDFLNLFDKEGALVDRETVDFAAYTEDNFPFDVKQPPSNSNALGLVKFMFPNRYNIYLHDTPAKSLFGAEQRAFSHGCIRLQDPFDFAYALLAPQSDDPQKLFLDTLALGEETVLPLEQPVPVHLIYRTAIWNPEGQMEYRRDVYGRDGLIWDALQQAGVALLGEAG